eukprot:6406548-Prymnesium_polylepis.1
MFTPTNLKCAASLLCQPQLLPPKRGAHTAYTTDAGAGARRDAVIISAPASRAGRSRWSRACQRARRRRRAPTATTASAGCARCCPRPAEPPYTPSCRGEVREA